MTTAAAEGRESPSRAPATCRHWLRARACLYGDSCKFAHPPDDAARSSVDDVESCRRPNGDGDGSTRRRRRRSRVRKRGKCGFMRRFLLDTYGVETLQSGVVVDVGGGRGELSFELENLNDVRCVVVDPQPLKVSRLEAKLRGGWYHRTAPLQRYNTRDAEGTARDGDEGGDDDRTGAGAGAAARRPAHWRLLWSPSLWSGDVGPTRTSVYRAWAAARTVRFFESGSGKETRAAAAAGGGGGAHDASSALVSRALKRLDDADVDVETARPRRPNDDTDAAADDDERCECGGRDDPSTTPEGVRPRDEVLKERRSPRERGRMGTSHDDAAAAAASPRRRPLPWRESQLVPGLRDGAWPSTTPGHPERGVGVMATMDVPRGTVLARETAYAALVQKPHKKTRCHFCFRPLSPAPVPCRGCRAAVYCDDSCRERCERSGEHALWECGGACWAAVLPTEAVLAARVACRRASEPSDVADGATSASSSDVAASTSASSSASDTTATPPRRAASSSPFERPPYAPDDAPPPRARRFDDLCLRWDDADAEERTLAAVEATVVAACLAARAVALRDVGVEVPRERVPGVVDVLGALCAIRANAFALKRAAAPAGDDGDDDDDAVFDPATVSGTALRKSNRRAAANDDAYAHVRAWRALSLPDVPVALAVFVGASRFNHACDPNAHATFPFSPRRRRTSDAIRGGGESGHLPPDEPEPDPEPDPGRTIVVRATRDATAGEWLCVSYGPVLGSATRAERRASLRASHRFECECVACAAAASSASTSAEPRRRDREMRAAKCVARRGSRSSCDGAVVYALPSDDAEARKATRRRYRCDACGAEEEGARVGDAAIRAASAWPEVIGSAREFFDAIVAEEEEGGRRWNANRRGGREGTRTGAGGVRAGTRCGGSGFEDFDAKRAARCHETLARARRVVREMETTLHPMNRLLAEARDVVARGCAAAVDAYHLPEAYRCSRESLVVLESQYPSDSLTSALERARTAALAAACGEWADAIALCDASIDILRAHGEDRAAGVAARVMTAAAAAAAAAAKSSRTKKSKAKASSSSSSPSHPSVAALGEDDDDPLFSLD